MSLRLHYSAISDVGRVRKDNQDSGYAGAWLLAVCDGVGGAARGDIASATAIQTLRELDVPPADDTGADLLDRVADTLHEAHLRIGQLVDADPALNGTSTTATVALFDGDRVGMGHVGDSRAYLFRDKELSRLTKDHTFVQSLIDEGRITEAESRVHPHRNLILKALDGMQEADPDLFMIELVPGDRLLLCSDGACGVLDDGRLADILSMGTPDFAAVELVRASLEAGSSDNVTCLVADVVTEEAAAADPSFEALEPLLVGAAAELRRRAPRAKGSLFRGHRSGDTGELDPIEDEIVGGPSSPSAPIDPEAARYAPIPPSRFQWLTRLLALVVVAGLVWAAAAAAYSWTQRQYFVGESDGNVVIYRGINTDLPGMDLSELYQTSDVQLDRLSDYDAGRVRQGIEVGDLDAARETVQNLSAEMSPAEAPDEDPGDTATETPTETPAGTGSTEGAG
ncbi:MAG: pstP [Nocardioides sp.]|nr:pstP [Nocardioides sp.]